MKIEELVSALNDAVGGSFEVSDGTCIIAVDDMVVNILEVLETGSIVMYARIGEHPAEDNVGRLSESLLAANHMYQGTHGATISYNLDDRCYYLNRFDSADNLNGEKFVKLLEDFVNTLEVWRKIVSDYRAVAAESEAPAEEAPMGGVGGFMQV